MHFIAYFAGCLMLLHAAAQAAEISMDGSLGAPGVLPAQDAALSDGTPVELLSIPEVLGTRRGANLFHSFRNFSLDPGQYAVFSGDAEIQNVINRVTGGAASSINGVIYSNIESADFYFINPAGVIFGPEARLSIDGSFYAGSADYLRLADALRFDAAYSRGSVFSSAPPAAFGFVSENPAPVRKQGGFLNVPAGETLAFIGGDIDIKDTRTALSSGRFLNTFAATPGGRIALFSAAGAGEVPLEPEAMMTADTVPLGRITLRDDSDLSHRPERSIANLDVSGEGGGVFLRADTISLDNYNVFADTEGAEKSQGIRVAARDLSLRTSRLTSTTLDRGDAGDIQIDVERLDLQGGSQIVSATSGSGAGGSVTVNASESIKLSGILTLSDGMTEVDFSSGLQSNTLHGGAPGGTIQLNTASLVLDDRALIRGSTRLAGGDAGNVEINTQRLTLLNGAQISVSSGSNDEPDKAGKAGTLNIQAEESVFIKGTGDIRHLDGSSRKAPAGLLSNTFTDSPGGQVTVRTAALQIEEGGTIQAGTEGAGAGGEIVLEVDTLHLKGDASLLSSTEGMGRAGRISARAREHVFISGDVENPAGNIRAATGGSGDAGTIEIDTPLLEMREHGAVESAAYGAGAGGAVTVTGGILDLREGARISARSSGTGNAGSLDVTVTERMILDKAVLSAQAEQAGGGNIAIDGTASWFFARDSEISARAEGSEAHHAGGNVFIRNQGFFILQDSFVLANAVGGDGGNISINTEVFTASADSVLDASSELGVSGSVQINAPDDDASAGLLAPLEKLLDKAVSLEPCRVSTKSSAFLEHVRQREAVPNAPDDWLTLRGLEDFTAADVNEALRGQLQRGRMLFGQGRFEQAAALWEEVKARPDLPAPLRLDVLRALADTYQNIGMYYQALEVLDTLLLALERRPDTARESRALTRLSDIWLAVGRSADALTTARKALETARQSAAPAAVAEALNNLANVLIIQAHTKEDYAVVFAHYAEARESAWLSDDALFAAGVEINRLNALWVSGAPAAAAQQLTLFWNELRALPEGYGKAFVLSAAGSLAESLHAENPAPGLPAFAVRAYAASLKGHHNSRLTSSAYSRLGALYHAEKRYAEAQRALNAALFYAAGGSSQELEKQYPAFERVYRYLWQKAQIYREQGDIDKAAAFYEKALQALTPVQMVLGLGYRNPVRSFDELIRPVYYEAAEVLFAQLDAAPPERTQTLLLKIRRHIEQLHLVEMRNYFRDACILKEDEDTPKDWHAPLRSAALHPIPLSGRLELLLTLPDGIRRIRVDNMPRQTLKALSEDFRRGLQARTRWSFIQPAGRLYKALIEPVQAFLQEKEVQTLTIVPDAFLRSIPFAPLFNETSGSYLLLEDYTLVVTPKFRNRPAASRRGGFQMLLAGTVSVEGYPPLPDVPKELAGIKKLADDKGYIQTRVLLDDAFSISEFSRALEQNAYALVHLATHGEFDSDPDNTYVLAQDGRINMERLKSLIGVGRFREQDLELLTLSACKTAVGDDRAALGLAGTAFRAGARNALASLWYVNDEATARLMQDFYAELIAKGQPKARALQQAQRRLMKSRRFQHPAYWAPFLLVGDST